MTMKARMSRGSKFMVRAASLQESDPYTLIGDLRAITMPESASDQIDVSTLDTEGRVKEFIPGSVDPGEITLEGNYNSADAGQDFVYDHFLNGEAFDWKLEVPSAADANKKAAITGKAVCTICKRIGDITEGELIPFNATLKVSGKTVFTAEA